LYEAKTYQNKLKLVKNGRKRKIIGFKKIPCNNIENRSILANLLSIAKYLELYRRINLKIHHLACLKNIALIADIINVNLLLNII
jgi:hypothetical protein